MDLSPFDLLADQVGLPRGTVAMELLREYERTVLRTRDRALCLNEYAVQPGGMRRVDWITPGWAYLTVLELTPEHEGHADKFEWFPLPDLFQVVTDEQGLSKLVQP